MNAQVRSLEQDEAQFLAKYYDLLEAITSTGSAGLGAGAVMVSKQISSIESTLKNIERLHQETYRRHGHLNHPEFFEKRRALFKKLDFALGSVARKGMSLDDDKNLKRALGLSSKSIVHNWKTAGVGGIPGYATHYERVARGAKYVRNVGYLGVTLDVSMSAMKIHEACTEGDERACQIVAYQEGGEVDGFNAGRCYWRWFSGGYMLIVRSYDSWYRGGGLCGYRGWPRGSRRWICWRGRWRDHRSKAERGYP
jgi:hypothetical protein